MKIVFSLDGKKKEIDVKKSATVAGVLEAENVNQETGLIKLNGKLSHPKTELFDGDVLEFVNIIYGG